MSEEDVTKTTRYVRALEAIADAANRAAEARRAYDEAFDVLNKLGTEKTQAEKALRETVDNFRQLTGKPPLAFSDREKTARGVDEVLKRLQGRFEKKDDLK